MSPSAATTSFLPVMRTPEAPPTVPWTKIRYVPGTTLVNRNRPAVLGRADSAQSPRVWSLLRNTIGNRNVSACTTRSRLRFVSPTRISVHITRAAPFP